MQFFGETLEFTCLRPDVLDHFLADEFLRHEQLFDRLIDLDKPIVGFPVARHCARYRRPEI